jgi:hypothetical protein
VNGSVNLVVHSPTRIRRRARRRQVTSVPSTGILPRPGTPNSRQSPWELGVGRWRLHVTRQGGRSSSSRRSRLDSDFPRRRRAIEETWKHTSRSGWLVGTCY